MKPKNAGSDTREGDSVYNSEGRLLGLWMRGAWYKYVDGPVGKRAWEVIEPAMSKSERALFDRLESAGGR